MRVTLAHAFGQVILEHYRVKHSAYRLSGVSCDLADPRCLVEKKTHSLFYRPYAYFAHVEGTGELPGQTQIAAINESIQNENYYQARLQAKELIAHTLEGLRYLQT